MGKQVFDYEESKIAINTGITAAILAAVTSLGRTGRDIYSGVKGSGKNFMKARRMSTLAPGNLDELMQYHLKGSAITPDRLKELDSAIMSTARGVESGDSNLTMLQALLRERELLEPAVKNSQNMLPRIIEGAGKFAADNPALTALGVALPSAAYITANSRNNN